MRASILALFATLATACAPRFGHDGLALFPQGSSARAFFEKCPHSVLEGTASWFCDTTQIFQLAERDTQRPRQGEIKAFAAREAGTMGKLVAEKPSDLQGEVSGMDVAVLGFERVIDDGTRPENRGLPPQQWIVFFGTQSMPDGTGLVVSCTLTASEASVPASIRGCHTGMKLLRDVMLAAHAK
jgi:hypothetical protein